MPKVSVIVPVYNTEKYIEKCILSLVNQSLDEIEILLIDDGSTDNSYEIMKKYETLYPQKVRVIRKENGGQGIARNLGIHESTGEYIGFADSDDWADSKMYENMYELATANNSDLVECRFRYLDEANNNLHPYGYIRSYKSKESMFIDPLVSPWNKLIRGDLLRSEKCWFTEGCIYEDTAFFVKLIPFINRSDFIDDYFVYHIKRSGSTMNINKSKKVSQIFTVLEDAISFYKSKDLFDRYYSELEYFCTKILLCGSMKRIAAIPDNKMRQEYKNDTFDFLNEKFPEYRKNRYLRNRPVDIYMKLMNKRLASFALFSFRIRRDK